MKKGARVLGSENECKIFSATQFEEHNKILKKKLCKVAKKSLKNVYSCYTKGVQEKDRF